MPENFQNNIQDKLTQVIDKLKGINSALSRKNKILLIGGFLVVLFIAAGGAYLLNGGSSEVLFSELTPTEATEIVTKISDMGVTANYDGNGTITVPKESADTLRAQLVLQGYPKNGLSYELFINNINMMSTDFEKNQYKLYDLQNRVAATIRHFDGVSDAVVAFALGEENKYVLSSDKKEPSAWATVTMKPGASLDAEQVRGIQRLVAKSIAGLSEENVSVFDENSRDLTLSSSASVEGGSAKLKRTLETEYENSIAAKLSHLLTPIYGKNNVRISVTCNIDVKKKIQERTTYTPSQDNKGVISQESTGMEVVGSGTSEGGVPGTGTNAEIPIYPNVTFDGEEIYYKDDKAFDYLVSQLKEQIQDDGGDVLDVSVAMVIGKNNLTNSEITDLRQTVSLAAGIDLDQAENKIAILASSFEDDAAIPASTDALGFSAEKLWERLWNLKWFLLGGLLGLLALIVIIRILMKKIFSEAEEELAMAQEKEDDILYTTNLEDIKKTREMELKEQIRDFADNNPEISAQLIRTWLKGGGGDAT